MRVFSRGHADPDPAPARPESGEFLASRDRAPEATRLPATVPAAKGCATTCSNPPLFQYLIRFHGVAPWSCAEKKLGGFTRDSDPVATVAIGTRAFARCCARDGGKKEGGVYAAPDLGGTSWRIWCGTRNGTYGIASLYPTDERPTCGD